MTAETRMSQDQLDAEAFRNFERAAHDEIADGYRDFFAAVTDHAIERLLDAASVNAGARVLDVATGPGVLAARASRRGASTVIGVDLSPRMVAIAAAQYPGLDFRQGDAEELPFPDRQFDAVVSNFGVGHFPRPERALGEFVRVLAPGGSVALSWWDIPARHRLNGIFFDAINEAHASPPADLPAGPPMFRFSEERELAALLQSAGLTQVAVTSHTLIHRLANTDELWNGILGGTVRTSIGIRRQPREVQERIRAAFDRLVRPYAVQGELQVPVAFKIGAGRREVARPS
jgi:SAM-dependent methyltransferase